MIDGIITREERQEFKEISHYCFGGAGYKSLNRELFYPSDWFIGIYEEKKRMKKDEEEEEEKSHKKRILASGLCRIPFSINVRKTKFESIGIQDVVTRPQCRNRGYSRKLLVETFKKMKEEGKCPISILYPFKESYYEKFGYFVASEIVSHQFSPETLTNLRKLPRYDDDLLIEEVFEYTNEIKGLRELVASSRMDYTILERKDLFWKQMMPEKTFKFVCFDKKSGEAVGYIIWYFEKKCSVYYTYFSGMRPEDFGDKKDVMIIREMHWTTKEARIELFRFIWSHRDQIKHVSLVLPKGENIVELFGNNGRDVKRMIKPNTMLRIVMLDEVFKKLRFVGSICECEFRVFVKDEICSWNHGVWKFVKKKESEHVEVKFEEGEEYDIDLDIKYLAGLVTGVRSFDELRENIGFTRCNQNAVEGLRNLFTPTRFNFINDTF